jgi:hypothetical protein
METTDNSGKTLNELHGHMIVETTQSKIDKLGCRIQNVSFPVKRMFYLTFVPH